MVKRQVDDQRWSNFSSSGDGEVEIIIMCERREECNGEFLFGAVRLSSVTDREYM